MTEQRYRGAGLTIVANRTIPGLGDASAGAAADLTLRTGQVPFFASASYVPVHADDTQRGGTPQVTVSRSRYGYRFEYSDDTRFWIDAAAENVWMTWRTTFEDACTYLIGPIIAFVLRRRGDVALHASAVRIGDSAVALIGPHGSGKSTTAAALARAGGEVITDDLLRLTPDRAGWLAHPYGNVVRLWPSSAALLYGDAEQLPRITASWDKRGLALGDDRTAVSARAPAPLGALVFLSRAASVGARCERRPVDGSAALLRLIANSSATQWLDAAARAHEFQALARLAGDVGCFEIEAGNGIRALDRLVQCLLR